MFIRGPGASGAARARRGAVQILPYKDSAKSVLPAPLRDRSTFKLQGSTPRRGPQTRDRHLW